MKRRDKNKGNKARRALARSKTNAKRKDSAANYSAPSAGQYLDRIESMAAELFLRDGHHTTTHMVLDKAGDMHLIADATSRGLEADLVAKTARRHGAVAVVSVGEAWMATGKGSAPPNVPASQIPGRSEVLVVAVESADESRSVMRRIIRNGNGVTLGERVDGMPNLWGGQFRHLFDGNARLGRSDEE